MSNRIAVALCLVSLALACATTTPSTERLTLPNILILLADDLGARDSSVYGSTFYETPNLDRLAAQGMRFTQAYAAGSVCSPTRASLQTGKYPPRTGVTDFIPGQRPAGTALEVLDSASGLAAKETTLAEAFASEGYRTFYAGKWHLGRDAGAPENHGFDRVLPETGRGIERGRAIVASAVEFMQPRDGAPPFFALLSFYEPHTPIERYPEHIAHFGAKAEALGAAPPPVKEHDGLTRARQDDVAYASEVAGLDDWIGLVLASLDSLDLARDTIVVLLSDNGGFSTGPKPGPTSNAPLRAGKGWLYEGGIRVPLVIRAPRVTAPGSTTSVPVITTDLFPTLLELAGLAPRPEQHRDGVSLAPLLGGGAAPAARPLFWHYPHYHGSTWRPGSAIRVGDWKLVELYDYDDVELYDLASDPGEANDVSAANPAVVAELRGALEGLIRETGAIVPKRVSASPPVGN